MAYNHRTDEQMGFRPRKVPLPCQARFLPPVPFFRKTSFTRPSVKFAIARFPTTYSSAIDWCSGFTTSRTSDMTRLADMLASPGGKSDVGVTVGLQATLLSPTWVGGAAS